MGGRSPWGRRARQAREFYEASLAAAEDTELEEVGNGGEGGSRRTAGARDIILTAKFLVATAVVPFLYDSNEHIAQVRTVTSVIG